MDMEMSSEIEFITSLSLSKNISNDLAFTSFDIERT
jgi:hypothetical protein